MLALVLAMFMAIAPVTLSINGHFFSGDTVTVPVKVTVPLNRDNRMLYVVWDGDGPKSSAGVTSLPLDEYTDKTIFQFRLRLTAGHYWIVAKVERPNGQLISSAVQEVDVIGYTPD